MLICFESMMNMDTAIPFPSFFRRTVGFNKDLGDSFCKENEEFSFGN